MPLEAFGQTDVGRRRKLNEDNFLVKPDIYLYAVCDGMGGHNAGEVASKMAIETLEAFIRKSAGEEKDITWPYGLEKDLSFEANRLKTAIKLANKKVFKAADNREEYTGMGTTVVAALLNDDLSFFANVGDSRAYVWHGGVLKRLTRDDSWVSAAMEGAPEVLANIEHHPMRHVLTKVVGLRPELEPSLVEFEFGIGDVLLLCTDGVHGALNDVSLGEVMGSGQSVADIAEAIVATAIARGATDNVTAIVVRRE
jgi:serine/threonine protein phosphatase PrpC